jgi:hypothetical protein
VTGLAQIQLPPDTDVESVRTKLVFDRCYVRNGGIWLDLRIMLGTVVYLLGFSYPAVRKAVFLPNPIADALTDTRPDHKVLGPFRVSGKVSGDRSLDVEAAPVRCREVQ